MKGTEESLGFGLLVGQKDYLLNDVMSILHNFIDFMDKEINK